jgi:hypothetical protein
VRLLAECSLNPTDRAILSHGYNFTRYVDDIHIFCESESDAQIAIHDLAEILDTHQKLTLQSQKTEVLTVEKFRDRAERFLVDRPLNEQEAEILRVIRENSGSDQDPYETIALADLSDEDLSIVQSDGVGDLVRLYLEQDPIDYTRLGWLFRRLSQVGTPAALNPVLNNLNALVPVLADVAKYMISASTSVDNLNDVGEEIIKSLDLRLVQHSEYLRIVLLNLFSRVPDLNHIDKLTKPTTGRAPLFGEK